MRIDYIRFDIALAHNLNQHFRN